MIEQERLLRRSESASAKTGWKPILLCRVSREIEDQPSVTIEQLLFVGEA